MKVKKALTIGRVALLFVLFMGLAACDGGAQGAGQAADGNTPPSAQSDANNNADASDNASNTNRADATPEGSDITISIAEITEQARFYPTTVDGTELEVLAIKASDGTVRTAFNTCQVCFDSGRGYYKQEGNALVCQNCKNRFGADDVEVKTGGCNPVPIFDNNTVTTEESITIPLDYLKEAKAIFANWKNR
ncbi:MAG: DUF2318 domain-containing protein [Coriobacteriales bacterium]|jgi:hypothetical protein|nr:DUF2318 domain-containing protein [Coriobacteriales bacterium]